MCKGHSIKQCHAGRPYIGTCKRESESLNMTYRDLLAKMFKAKVSTSCGKRNSVENVLKCPLHQERIIMMNKCINVHIHSPNKLSRLYVQTCKFGNNRTGVVGGEWAASLVASL